MKYLLVLLIICLIGIQGWTLKTQQQILNTMNEEQNIVDNQNIAEEFFQEWYESSNQKDNEYAQHNSLSDMCTEMAENVFEQLDTQSFITSVESKKVWSLMDTEEYKNATEAEQQKMTLQRMRNLEEAMEFVKEIIGEAKNDAIIFFALCK